LFRILDAEEDVDVGSRQISIDEDYLCPFFARAHAMLEAKKLLPTPPFPPPTAITFPVSNFIG